MTTQRKTCQVTNTKHKISPLLLIMTQSYRKTDGTAFKVLCVCLCVCAYVCLSYEWLIQIKLGILVKTTASLPEPACFCTLIITKKTEDCNQVSFSSKEKRIYPTLSSNSLLCTTCLYDKHMERHILWAWISLKFPC